MSSNHTLLVVGGIVGLIGVAASVIVDSLLSADDSNEAVPVVGGLTIVVLMAAAGFVAGWFGRERDDVVVAAVGAGLVAAVALAIASLFSEERGIASVVLAIGVVIAGGVAGVVAWLIGDFICDGRELPTARRLVAPAYAESNPGYPLWTTEAGPAIRATLDELADRVDPGDPIDGRAVGIVVGLPRDVPVVLLLAGDRLVIQPVDLNGAVNGELRSLVRADITEVASRSVRSDGTERAINAYDDVITIRSTDGSLTRLRLPYGTRGVAQRRVGPT